MRSSTLVSIGLLSVFLLTGYFHSAAQDQKISNYDRDVAKNILGFVEDDVRKHYYDPKYHGMNLDSRFAEAAKKIDSAPSLNVALSDVAAAIADLNDSHTFLMPPLRPYVHDYGWRMKFIGVGGAFITAVRPGSDAEKQGLKPGDQVLAVEGFSFTRNDFWKVYYVFWVLRPQPSLHLRLKSPDGKVREVEAKAYFRATKKTLDLTQDADSMQMLWDAEREEWFDRPRYALLSNDIIVMKLANFELNEDEVGAILGRIRSRPSLVLDLRGNPGGYVDAVALFAGGLFDHEVKIADRVGRKPDKPLVAKSLRHYSGKIVVLIDSDSASGAELLARVLQLNHRATVIGDRSSGSVMQARTYMHSVGAESVVPFGVSVTDADMIMADGKSLEHAGVIPDTLMLPTASELQSGSDPAMAYAVQQAGGKITPEDAGKLFPAEWPPLSTAVFGSH